MAIIRDYRSWAEYREALATVNPKASVCGGKDFSGTDTVADALRISDCGWPEGAGLVRDIALPAVQATTSHLSQNAGWDWDVCGSSYDVGAYLTGLPECWLTASVPAQKPVITIGANIVSSGGIPQRVLSMRGAAVVALTMALQTAGYAVRVFAIEGSAPCGKTVWHRVCLSDDAGGPLDTDRLLFALAHPSSARQLGYALSNSLAGVAHGNGWIDWPESNPRATPPADWATDLYLAPPYFNDADWESAESVQRWVADTYAKLTAADSTAAKG